MSTKYPEHDKLHAVKDKSQLCGEFLEWLQGKYVFAEYCTTDPEHEGELWPARVSVEKLLAEFFNINTKKLEDEKRQILEECRKNS